MPSKKLQEQVNNATLGLFSGMTETKQEAEQTTEKPEQVKKAKKMFSVRMDADRINQWKAYVEATGNTAEAVMDLAITEYMERHKLKAYQQSVYDLKLKLLEARQ